LLFSLWLVGGNLLSEVASAYTLSSPVSNPASSSLNAISSDTDKKTSQALASNSNPLVPQPSDGLVYGPTTNNGANAEPNAIVGSTASQATATSPLATSGWATNAALTLATKLNAAISSKLALQTETSNPVYSNTQQALAAKAYANLPIGFEANQGQFDSQAKFKAAGHGYTLFFSDAGTAWINLISSDSKIKSKAKFCPPLNSKTDNNSNAADTEEIDSHCPQNIDNNGGGKSSAKTTLSNSDVITNVTIKMYPTGSNLNPNSQAQAQTALSNSSSNYFLGKDSSKWHTNISNYAGVVYKNIYPGIDLSYYGTQNNLEHDFIVSPQADPSQIALAFDGITSLQINKAGEVVLSNGSTELKLAPPNIYQIVKGVKHDIDGSYVISKSASSSNNKQVGFQIGSYDHTLPLTIDPILQYSSYFGGTSLDSGRAIVVDNAGNIYVSGYTGSPTFITTPGAFQTTIGGPTSDLFIMKLNPTGTAVLYSTYLGGTGNDYGYGMALDANNDVYVTGSTGSSDFPITSGAFQTTLRGPTNAFVAKLNPTGTALLYSTYFGGTGTDQAYGLAIDSSNNAYITGVTNSTNLTTTTGAFQTALIGTGSTTDAFVAKFNSTGTALLYSTYFGGTGNDYGYGIAVDSTGSAYVAGYTGSADLSTTAGVLEPAKGSGTGGYNGFVTKLNASGTGLSYSTYLGGGGSDQANSIVVDSSGDAYVGGYTTGDHFPITSGAAQSVFGGGADAFLTKLNPTGTAAIFSTFIGGSDYDYGYALAIDANGNSYVTGITCGTHFVTTSNAVQSSYGGDPYDSFVTQVSADGAHILYSSYIGGNSYDHTYAIAADNAGNAYLAGITASTNFQTTTNGLQTTIGGRDDAFVMKLALSKSLVFSTQPGGNTAGVALTPQPVVQVQNPGGSVDTTFNGSIVLNIKGGSGTSGAVLGGTTTINAVNGVATFTGLSIDRSGTGYILSANGGALPSVDSQPFNVTANAANITAQAGTPQSTVINTAFNTPLQALVTDANHNPLTGITVVFTTQPTAGSQASATFAGGVTTVNAVTNASGIATTPTFAANGSVGSYKVIATPNGASISASFILTNLALPDAPDLSIGTDDIILSSLTPTQGDSLTVQVTVHNIGQLNATAATLQVIDSTGGYSGQPVTNFVSSATPLVPFSKVQVTLTVPVQGAAGNHQLCIQLSNVSPAENILTNNNACQFFNVLVPAAPLFHALAVKANDLHTWAGAKPDLLVTIANNGTFPETINSVSIGGADAIFTTFSLSSAAATQLPLQMAPGAHATLLLVGNVSTNITTALVQTLTVTINDANGGTTSSNFTAYVAPQAPTTLKVTVWGSYDNGPGPITSSQPQVMVDGDNNVYNTDASGNVTIQTSPGNHTVYAYAPGYNLVAYPVGIPAGQQGTAVITLAQGNTLSVTDVSTVPLTQDDLTKRGISVTDPNNYWVYDFTLYLGAVNPILIPNVVLPTNPTSGTAPVTISNASGNTSTGGNDGDGGVSVTGTVNFLDNGQRQETWMIIPGKFKILKQFWAATVFIRNNATNYTNNANAIVLKNIHASLNTGGLTLATGTGTTQAEVDLPDIPVGGSDQATWILRGDATGVYQPKATITGNAQLAGSTSIPLSAVATSQPLKVYQPTLNVTFNVPNYVVAGTPFDLKIDITNTTPINIYSLAVSLDASKMQNVHLATGQVDTINIATIVPGQMQSVTFSLVSQDTGFLTDGSSGLDLGIAKGSVSVGSGVTATLNYYNNTSVMSMHLAFVQQPSDDFNSLPIVAVYDAGNNIVSTFQGSVALEIIHGTGSPSAVLQGETTVGVVNGLATFTSLGITPPGTNYKLLAMSRGAATSTSAAFNISDKTKPSNMPDFSSLDSEDLYTKVSNIAAPANSTSPMQMTFNIGRYYGLVDSNNRLIDASTANCTTGCAAADKTRNAALHGNSATIYMWVFSRVTIPAQTVNLQINNNGGPDSTATPVQIGAIPAGGTLVSFSIPVDQLYFPNICKGQRKNSNINSTDNTVTNRDLSDPAHCLRYYLTENFYDPGDPTKDTNSKVSVSDGPQTFADLTPAINNLKLSFSNPAYAFTPQTGFLFLNGVRPVLLMGGFNSDDQNGCNPDAMRGDTSTFGGTDAGSGIGDPGYRNDTNWIYWLSSMGIPSWNPARNGNDSVDCQQVSLQAGAFFLKAKYGVKRINLLTNSMGGLTSHKFVYDVNVNKSLGNIRIDHFVTFSSPHGGVLGAGLASFGIHNPAIKDLTMEGAYSLNSSHDLSNAWDDAPTNHVFLTTTPARRRFCPPLQDVCYSAEDGLVENFSAFGMGYPGYILGEYPCKDDNGSVIVCLGIPSNPTQLYPGNYATREDNPVAQVCDHVKTISGFPPIDIVCHSWSMHSTVVKDWVLNTAHINDYTKNWIPNILNVGMVNPPSTPSQNSNTTTSSSSAEVTLLNSTAPLTTGNTVTLPLTVDANNLTNLVLNVTTNDASTFQAQLKDASGTVVTSMSSAASQFSYDGSALTPGSYTLTLTPVTVSSSTSSYAAQASANSNLAIVSSLTPYTLGSATQGKVKVILNNSTTNTPVTGATLTAVATASTANGIVTANITLTDDGTNGDTTANDGIYTGLLPADPSFALLSLTTKAVGTLNGASFVRYDTNITQVNTGELTFSNTYNNYTWSTSAQGATSSTNVDSINFNAPVNVNLAGVYQVEATLAANDGTIVDTRSTTQSLTAGNTNTVTIAFSAGHIQQLQHEGPYRITSLVARLVDGQVVRETDALSNVSSLPTLNLTLSGLASPALTLNGAITDRGTNADANSKFQTLQVTIPLKPGITGGPYNYSVALRSGDGTLVLGSVAGQLSLQAGTATTITANFDGSGIVAAGQNGPYTVTDLVIKDPTTNIVLFYVNTVGTTSSYTVSQFVAGPTQFTISTGSNQSASLNNAFGTNLQVLVKDASGNPINSANVTFAAPTGSSVASGTFAGGTNSVTVSTDGSGLATAPAFTANGIVGSYNVSASIASVATPLLFALNNMPLAPMIITVNNYSPNINDALNASLTVVNPTTSAIALNTIVVVDTYVATNAQVNTFTKNLGGYPVPAQGQVTISNDGSITVAAPNGVHQFCAQVFMVGSSYGNTPACTTVVVGGATTAAALAGTSQTAAINTSFATPLQVKITNAAGSGVSGVSITFTAPASGASGSFTVNGSPSATVTVLTDANGVATAPAFTANGTTGNYSISTTINTPGLSALTTPSFTLTNQ
jgi:hypothetical protein